MISLTFNLVKEQRNYLKVFYSLKWQLNLEHGNFLEILSNRVTDAFKALDFTDPQSESETIMMIWNGAMMYTLRNKSPNAFIIYENLLDKFDL